jgi:uncharacterized protein (DUF2252 family)
LDPVRLIQDFNAVRDPERLRLKYRSIRTSPFGFLRGSCHLFHARLPRGGIFKSTPLVWSSGDLHLENFGGYKADNRLVHFDLNDFDESALAPAAFDLVRFLVSLRVVADGLRLTEAQSQALCQIFLDAYATALAQGKAYWLERETAQGLLRALLDGLRDRQRAAFLDARTVVQRGARLLRTDGKKALPASAAQRQALIAFMNEFARSQADPDFFAVLDVARRVAGTGSLGVGRYAILVQGKGSPDGNHILDLKQALPSSLLSRLKTPQPRWKSEAQRIVEVQRRMQAVPMAFLQAVRFDGKPWVLRAVQPSEDRLALHSQPPAAADRARVLADLGRLLAWAQLRSAGREGSAIADELMDFGRRRKWKAALLLASKDSAAQVLSDATTFNRAWDDGAFAPYSKEKFRLSDFAAAGGSELP